tara:strand:- start:1686 stop:1955 length:270 start_codon:yes stop_codon:yes gene_type:complete
LKYQEMIDRIKQHHPHLGEKEIRQLVNDAQAELAERAKLTNSVLSISVNADQRYYSLDAKVSTIKEVYFDDLKISRLIDGPVIDDTTGE